MNSRTKKRIGWSLVTFVILAILGPFYYFEGFVVMTTVLLIALGLVGMLITGLYLIVGNTKNVSVQL